MRAGSARIEITPPQGVAMGGYFARAEPAEGVHDPLFARALVLDDGEQRVALLSADLAEITPAFAADVRLRIENEQGIPSTHTLLAVTHTHAGPLVAGRRVSAPDPMYVDTLRDRLVGVVRAAARVLRPARVGAGRARVYLGVNRRRPLDRQDPAQAAAGGMRFLKGAEAKASPRPPSLYARVLLVAEEGGGPIGILFTYGAHPVVLGPENRKISGDYAGCAERVVEENFGDKAPALFAIGFAGDVDVEHSKRNFEEVETLGTSLGRAVLEEIKAIEPAGGLGLRARSLRAALPLEPPPSVEDAERRLFAERERLAAILGRGEDKAEVLRRRMMVDWASQLAAVARGAKGDQVSEMEVQGIAIGRIALVGVAAEPFAEYEAALQELSPFPHTFPIGCANGNTGYVPTAAAFAEGGYEVDAAPYLYGVLRLRPDADAVVRQSLARILADLAG